MTKTKIPVLITAIGGGGVGEQILKALLIANRDQEKYYIIGGDVNPCCPQFQMADEAVCLPGANDQDFMDALLSVCKKKSCQAVFPGCEPDLRRISQDRATLEGEDILVPVNPSEVINICMDKTRTGKVLADLGFAPPRYIEARDYDELSGVDWFPVVIKPSYGGGGSAHSYIAQSQEELRHLMAYLTLALPGQRFVVQEYVGTDASEYTVGVLHDLDGHYINSIAVRRELKSQLNVRARYKNNTGRSDLGANLVISSGISHGYVGRFPEITSSCRDLAKALGVCGPANIQLRVGTDGKIKVFEINPRFSGTTSIRAMKGYNEPDILIRKHILGETIEQDFAYEEGMILRNITETSLPDSPAPCWKTYVAEKISA